MKTSCFGAGPAKMDEAAQKRFVDMIQKNPSILELSHRSEEFHTFLQKTKENLRALLDVPSEMEILFLSGGSSFQFLMCAQNLLYHKAGYLITGLFSRLACEAACQYGPCDVLYDNSAHPYDLDGFPVSIEGKYDYVYTCLNNSIYGTRTPDFLCSCPVVADASSCLGIEKLDWKRYALVFASAQKNFGISGMTLVFVRKNLNFHQNLPDLISYPKLMEADSLLNTPPVLSIAACGLCAEEMLKRKESLYLENRNKAEAMYRLLDESDFYHPLVKKHRSLMNIPFQISADSKEFLEECQNQGFTGLKGHRLTGHFRASFNAHVRMDEVYCLINWMKEMESLLTK